MFIIFLFDVFYNSFVIKISFHVLPYFGFYQFCYSCNMFVISKMNKDRDIYVTRILYDYDLRQFDEMIKFLYVLLTK